jgi:hypothetical protein
VCENGVCFTAFIRCGLCLGFLLDSQWKMMECVPVKEDIFSYFGYFISVVVDNGRGRKIVVLIEFGFRFHFK